MRLQAMLCVLVLTGCATVPSTRPTLHANPDARGGSGESAEAMAEPVRMETSVGAFLVQPNNAEDFARLLAGEPTQQQYYSVTDAP